MRKIVLILIVLLIAGGIVGYYMWNKRVPSLEDAQAKATVTADQLCEAFISDEEKANKDLLNQVVIVSGTVHDVFCDSTGTNIILSSCVDCYMVNCRMEPGRDPKVEPGQAIKLKGIVNGFNMFDVNINRCVTVSEP